MTTSQPTPAPRADLNVRMRIVWPLVIVLIAFAVASIAYGVLAASGLSDDDAKYLANIVSSGTILGLGIARYRALPRFERRLVRARKTSLAACVFIGIGLALALRIAVGMVVAIGQAIDPAICERLNDLADEQPTVMWHKLTLVFALVVLAPLGEELVFRGLFLRGLVRRMQFPLAATISGVVFAVAHAQYWLLWPLLIGISGFGIVAAWVYRQWGFPANVAMHAAFNAVAAVTLFTDFGLDAESQDCS